MGLVLRNKTNEFYGMVGEKAPFQDTNGDNLYVGDVVKIEGSTELSIVCKDEIKHFGVMGIWGEDSFTKDDHWHIYKEKSYKSMGVGNKVRHIKYTEDTIKEMTISEIEKELGYSIKIIKEN